MKLPRSLFAAVLMAAVAGRMPAQDQPIKFAVPGEPGSAGAPDASAAAPAATAAPAPSGFTDVQLAEEFGWFMAKRVGVADLQFTPTERDALLNGIGAAVAGKDSPYDLNKVGPEMDAFMQRKQAAYLAKVKLQSTQQADAFFAQLKNDKNVVQTPSGLCYEIQAPGVGPMPKTGDTVKVNYTGRLLDGTVFDTSLQPRQPGGTASPAEFQLGEGIIAGWTEGIQKIAKGGKIKLYIPANLAYGDDGRSGIPPGAALIFDIELLDINPADAPAAK